MALDCPIPGNPLGVGQPAGNQPAQELARSARRDRPAYGEVVSVLGAPAGGVLEVDVAGAGGEASPESAWATTTPITAAVTAVSVINHQIPIGFA